MALRQTKKISELPALSPASLNTTFVVGISGSTTYKISINNLTSSLDTTFATDLVTNALSNTLDTKLSTSSFNSYTASISTGSLVTSISNLNTFTASQSTSSLVDRLNTIESVSGSWITESETGSFLTSLSGAISSSSQLTSSYDTRYTLSGSVQPLPSNLVSSSAQITEFGFISSSTTINTSSFATTGSNSFNGSQTITGSLIVSSVAVVNGAITIPTGSTITLTSGSNLYVQNNGLVEITGSLTATSITGSIAATNGVISGSSQLSTTFPSKTTGSWSVPAGASTRSFTVDWNHSYQMWVIGNIPNGIISWNATVNVTNANVPIVGSQYGWYYVDGNALVLTSIPAQIVGVNGAISTASFSTTTSNTFEFGITNNSGTTQTINYGYIKLS